MSNALTLLTRPVSWMPEARRRQLGMAILAAFAVTFPIWHNNDADIDSMANAASYAVLALGLNIVVGFAGLLDLGYAAFFAIGAYTYGILTSFQVEPAWSQFWVPFQWLGLVAQMPAETGSGSVVHFTLSFWLALPFSAAFAAFWGVLFGAPTLRLRGDYLAIVTLGFGEIVPIVVRNWSSLTAGAAGLNGVAAPQLFGWSFGVDATPYYYVAICLVALLMFVSIRLRDSRIGRAWMAIREDEIAAGCMGINLTRFKLLAFAIGAAFGGMTGVFYVAKLQTATPDMFGFPVSVMILVMIVFGGIGSVWGVVVGAFFLQLLQSWWLEDLTGWVDAFGRLVHSPWLAHVDLVRSIELIFGFILVGMMLFRRDGLIPAVRKQAALSFDQQHAVVQRGGFADLKLQGLGGDVRTGAAALEAKGVTVRFGGLTALDAVDITVPNGSVVAVIGPNGSGKSTLFNAITGLVPAEAGSIRFHGEEILGLPPHEILRKGVARTFQNLRLFTNLTVMENALIGQHARLTTGVFRAILRLPGTLREEDAARIWAMEIFAIFGNRLAPRVMQMVSGLSYANRRRIEIARALASRPRILLLDEPTAGMNPAETLELAEQIKGLNALGLTVLLIEHKLDVVTTLADTVYVLDHGEVIAHGRPDEVRRDEEVLRAYLGRNAQAAAAGVTV
ncbi:MAG TPA: branched-chain amino acid ABC transporter ATP-binding protein/permease [Acetobacteraceae bacterium]|jgi:branched-chain amino acid transport system permease protein|nr:branched-chain amino acid ABC transporter ATP-binding protein/permease [Acetobacteraceae bacterium]